MDITKRIFRKVFPVLFSIKRLLPETIIFFAIGTIDLIATAILAANKIAVEANPLVAWTFKINVFAFCVFKFLTYFVPLLIVEKLKTEQNKNSLRLILKAGMVGYLTLYLVYFLIDRLV